MVTSHNVYGFVILKINFNFYVLNSFFVDFRPFLILSVYIFNANQFCMDKKNVQVHTHVGWHVSEVQEISQRGDGSQ